MNEMPKDKNFDLYWLSYLGAHTHPTNRLSHYIGTIAGVFGGLAGKILISLFSGIVTGMIGYNIVLLGHFIFQKNSPHASRSHLGVFFDFLMSYFFLFDRTRLIR